MGALQMGAGLGPTGVAACGRPAPSTPGHDTVACRSLLAAHSGRKPHVVPKHTAARALTPVLVPNGFTHASLLFALAHPPGYTIHGTHGLLVQGNTGFHVDGSCFYIEDGNEERNTIDGNFAGYVHPLGRNDTCTAVGSVFSAPVISQVRPVPVRHSGWVSCTCCTACRTPPYTIGTGSQLLVV